jgi:KUP system potassium uptake protein
MYSLLCRHANIGILPSKRVYLEEQPLLHDLSALARRPNKLGKFFERSITARRALLFMAILGMCMLIGDGILTPAISGLLFVVDICNYHICDHIDKYHVLYFFSVLSAIDGLRGPFPSVSRRKYLN